MNARKNLTKRKNRRKRQIIYDSKVNPICIRVVAGITKDANGKYVFTWRDEV